MIDTHAHLYDAVFDADREAVMQRAKQAGVERVYLPNCDVATLKPLISLAQIHPDFCFPMVGLHPCYVKENFREELATLHDYLAKRAFAAVGEIGLDYYWDKTFVPQQHQAFQTQMDWAKQHGLPIVIHSRESTDDCIRLVREAQDGRLRGIFHCFSGTLTEAEEIIDLGFLLGIGGVITYKTATVLQEVVRRVPLERLVLETDAPYLSPVPHRGKRNEPAHVALVAQKIAELRGVDMAVVQGATTAAALALFCAG